MSCLIAPSTETYFSFDRHLEFGLVDTSGMSEQQRREIAYTVVQSQLAHHRQQQQLREMQQQQGQHQQYQQVPQSPYHHQQQHQSPYHQQQQIGLPTHCGPPSVASSVQTNSNNSNSRLDDALEVASQNGARYDDLKNATTKILNTSHLDDDTGSVVIV